MTAQDTSVYTVTRPDGSTLILKTVCSRAGVVRLYVDGDEVAQCGGSGVDKRAVVIGQWFATLPEAQPALDALTPNAITTFAVTYGPRGKRIETHVKTVHVARDPAHPHVVPENYGLYRYVHDDAENEAQDYTYEIHGNVGYDAVAAILEHCGYHLQYIG